MKTATVIGSGISGLSIGRMLSNRYNVQILERSAKAGGLIKCDRVNGSLFHRVGGHVFNSKNQAVLNWFWAHFNRDEEFLQARRNARILFNDKLLGYPVENYLYQLPEQQLRPIMNELLSMLSQPKQATEYSNFKDFLIGSFGERLYNLYFGPYNSKIWNTNLSEVPLEWLEGKLPMPELKDIIISNIMKKEESTMVHASFYYPKNNGSQFIIDRLATGQNINLSYNITRISTGENGGLYINDMATPTDVIVYCGDIRQLGGILAINDEKLEQALADVRDLPSNGTSNVLCETDDNDISWLYLPEEKYKAHRIIYTGNFSSTNNNGEGRKTCVVEFSGRHDQESMIKELALLPGNLKPIAFNYEPNSYIIQHKKTRKKVKQVKQALARYNIYLLGRFAEWEYYNMDKCVEAAMELDKNIG